MAKRDLSAWVPKLEAAERLGISARSVERLVETKKIRAALRPTPGKKGILVIHPEDIAKVETERLRTKLIAAKSELHKMFVTLAEAAALTGLTESTLQNFMVAGKLPFLELEEGLRIRRRDLDAL